MEEHRFKAGVASPKLGGRGSVSALLYEIPRRGE